MPVIELAIFPASDAFLAENNVIKPALECISKLDGWVSTYYGMEVLQKRTVYVVVVWDSYERHKYMMEHSEYPEVSTALLPSIGLGDHIQLQHVEFSEDAANALTAPFSCFLTATLKEGRLKEDIIPQLEALSSELGTGKECRSPVVWGESKEHRGTFVLVVGWNRLEAEEDSNIEKKQIEKVLEGLHAKIASVADVSLVNVQMTHYSV